MASPNFDDRPPGAKVELVVIHNISLPPGEFGGPYIEDLFLNRLHPGAHPYFAGIAHLKVSAHFLIRRDGQVVQFVDTDKRAWHAGVSSWKGRERVQRLLDRHRAGGHRRRAVRGRRSTRRSMRLAARCRRATASSHLAGHSDIAPGRKTDPGPYFDWSRVRR